MTLFQLCISVGCSKLRRQSVNGYSPEGLYKTDKFESVVFRQ